MSNPAYESVLTILHARGWPADCAPAPEATARFFELNADATPEEVVGWLEAYLDAAEAANPMPADVHEDARAFQRRRHFTRGMKFWEIETSIALGLASEPRVPQGRVARTVLEWWENQDEGLSYLGYPLLDPTPEGNAEKAKRWAAAMMPADTGFVASRAVFSDIERALVDQARDEWAFAGLATLYQLLVREGLLKPWARAALTPPAELLEGQVTEFAGLDAQKILDNLHGARRRFPPRVKWLPGGVRNSDWRD